jgi:ATP-dependent RNA helicase DeaD
MTFSDLHLRPELAQTATDLGYLEPTPIQAGLIPVLLDGRDAIGQARTGTGKTAAFALPLLQKLAEHDDRGTIRALVLCPTRELAVQVSSAVYTYGEALDVRTLPIYGGQPYHKQIRRIRRGVDVVVATPGRLVDLLNRQAIDLSAVETVVLDEADEMLSMGFADDLEAILQATPETRQTALLSATLPKRIQKISATYLRDPETVAVAEGDRTAEDVEQTAFLVYGRDKLNALVRLIETDDVTSALAFVRTREATARLAADLSGLGYAAEPISGELSQAQRTAVLARFKKQQVRILVGTDVAARGLDIDHVSHVFNVDLPVDAEAYVHRVGRTGRAGREGTAYSLVDPRERGLLHRVERAAQREIPFAELPSVEDVEAARVERLVAAVAENIEHPPVEDRKVILDLVSAGEDPMRIAAAALAVARKARHEMPIEPIAEVNEGRGGGRHQNRSRSHHSDREHAGGRSQGGGRSAHEDGFVRLALDAGRDIGIRPGQVVSALARTADIPGKALGKILIEDRCTLVDVPQPLVDAVLAQSGDYRFGKRLARIEVA